MIVRYISPFLVLRLFSSVKNELFLLEMKRREYDAGITL